MVFNKPSGLVVIPTPKKEKRTLRSLVNEHYRNEDDPWHLHPCHRLDKDTSGCILFAKGKQNQRILMDLFKLKKIRKKYYALAQGRIVRMKGTISSAIESFESRKFKNRDKKPAVTKYRVVIRKKSFSIVDIEPVTGRSNQIRIHFKQIGHPLVGERKYAFGKDFKLKFHRCALHAQSLQWVDPLNHEKIVVEAPVAEDIEKFVKQH